MELDRQSPVYSLTDIDIMKALTHPSSVLRPSVARGSLYRLYKYLDGRQFADDHQLTRYGVILTASVEESTRSIMTAKRRFICNITPLHNIGRQIVVVPHCSA